MDERQTKVTVEFLGEQYPIKGDADAERIMQVAAWLHDRMKKIAQLNSRLTSRQIAIMTAMNLADDYLKLEADYRALMEMVKQQTRKG